MVALENHASFTIKYFRQQNKSRLNLIQRIPCCLNLGHQIDDFLMSGRLPIDGYKSLFLFFPLGWAEPLEVPVTKMRHQFMPEPHERLCGIVEVLHVFIDVITLCEYDTCHIANVII